MRKSLIILPIALLAGAAQANLLEAPDPYHACTMLVATDPDAAYDQALAWRDLGGGAGARHCVALALLELGHPEEAAVRLEALAQRSDAGGVDMRALILGQSANAWLVARRPDAALLVLEEAIRLDQGSLDLRLDKAAAHALKRDWVAVAGAAEEAIAVAPEEADGYVWRARARFETGDTAGARPDLDLALYLDPANVEALVLRGEIAQDFGP